MDSSRQCLKLGEAVSKAVVILAVDDKRNRGILRQHRRHLIAVQGGENLVERLRLIRVKTCPEGTRRGGICLIFINLDQLFWPYQATALSCYLPWFVSIYVKDVVFGVRYERVWCWGAWCKVRKGIKPDF
jgi:hypothetical protein